MHAVRGDRKGIVYLHWLNAITTFSFAILFSSLSLYLTKNIGLTQMQSNGIVGFFLASNFILHFVAGYIGDRFLSNRLLFAISTLIQTLGLIVLNFSDSFVYLGLSLFLIGCGLGSTCINCLITQQFTSNENELREKAFFHNYSAMNIGFLSGYVMSGFIDIHDRYDRLFEVSNLINLITVFFIIKSWRYFEKNKVNTREEIKRGRLGLILIIFIIPILLAGFYYSWLANGLILFIGAAALFYITLLGRSLSTQNARKKIYSFVFLTISSIVFWMLYFVGPMGVTQFLKYNVNIYIGSYYIPPQWLMNLNSIFVIIGSPIAITLFDKLRKQQITISISKQFMCSLVFIALSFLILTVGIMTCGTEGLTGMVWIIAHYLLQAIGELLIGPVGYAMIGSLAPEKLQGLMMGIWMMASGIAATLSNYFSNLMTQSESLNPLVSNEHYLSAFTQLGLYAIFGALILWFCSKTIEKSIQKTSVKAIEGMA
ncbi:peptide MFS transporter [Legionella bononiensis]|uniref:MFS transporter n=1 Tax=Legionella bononiensis TaxID=2793102 RepID=A0ABS1WC70_9GAMM|nr:oligopeptide:H+ symporter [Legionella bononiensis]MBL7478741.1 MFS transporter [Legionella bononiensis]MBL7526948.1 MFS transporter [Legionella bononiensis]MBL7562537.1 MFS transporter [Legionella bononiensis]HAT8068425.1 MFS transporter [Legionella pneumophila]